MAYKGIAISLAVFVAACGSVQSSIDAGDDDDDVDAATAIDATSVGPINVTTLTRCCTDIPNAPKPGVRVIITNPDGSVGATGTTDNAGEITLEVIAGSSVTAVYVNPSGNGTNQLVTYADVAPGESYTFGQQFSTTSTTLGTMTVSWANLPAATGYRVHYPCGSQSATPPTNQVTITEFDTCHVASMDLLLVASDANGPIRWGLLPDVTFSNGGSTSLNTWQPMTTLQLSATNLPAVVEQMSMSASAVLNGRGTFSAGLNGTPVNGSLSGTQPWTTGGDAIQLTAQLARTNLGLQQILMQLPGTSTSATLDAPPLLPWLGEVIASSLARQVSWIQEGEGGGDCTVIFLRWATSTPALGGSSSHEWILLGPPGPTTVAIPDLGAAAQQYMPQPTNSLSVNGGIVDLGSDDGYAAYRTRPEWEATLEDESVLTGGSVTVSVFTFN